MDEFDAIVVGAGPAGSAAALKLAQEDANVLLVDRAKPIGAKNLSGGVVWGHELARIIPDWYKKMPVERPITRKGVHMMTGESDFSINFETERWRHEPYNAHAVLRARIDPWLAEQVEKEGGMVIEGVNVEDVAWEGDRVVGVEQSGETIRGKTVIVADGANSRLSIKLGLRDHEDIPGKMNIERAALGIKEIIELPEDTINERFNVRPDEGVAHEYVLGWLPGDVMAGGFLYTNRDTISLGIVIRLESLWNQQTISHDIMEEFRLHPSIEPLLDGGKMVEYGAHLIPEGGLEFVERRHGPGWMLVGDAAGFCFSNGIQIQGINYAVGSGIRAAETVLDCKERGDWSERALGGYVTRLQDSYIWEDFERFSGMEDVVWNPRFHKKYPHLIESIFTELLTQDETPKRKTRDIVRSSIKDLDISLIELMRDGMTGAKNL